MTLHPSNFSNRPLAAIAALLLMHVGIAGAADPRNATPDAEALARHMLVAGERSAAADARIVKVRIPAEAEIQKSHGDPQAAAQRLLLGRQGTTHFPASAETKSAGRPVPHGDAQWAAQQMLLGQHPASEATRPTTRAIPAA